jgi:hypothetical protein
LQAPPLYIDSLFRRLRKSHYDYATELFFGFVGGGLAVSVFERQHKLDACVAHVAYLVINGPDLQPFGRGSASGSVPIAFRRHGDLAQKSSGSANDPNQSLTISINVVRGAYVMGVT